MTKYKPDPELYALNGAFQRRLQDAMGEVANQQLLEAALCRTVLDKGGKLDTSASPNAYASYIELMKACQQLMTVLYSVMK